MFDIFPEAVVDTEAIKDNFLKISKVLPQNCVCSSVVKDDSYGLGADVVSKKLYEAGCRDFWVAYLEEAIEIRKDLPFDANIYFLQGFHISDIELIKTQKIIPVINSVFEFNAIKGKDIPFVIHVDTGLSRLGIQNADLSYIFENLKRENIPYIISHLACSDEESHELNLIQKNRFDEIINAARKIMPIKAGISATGGAILGSNYSYDIVRIGAFLYGINLNKTFLSKNVLSLYSTVLQKYEAEPNTTVGYGATYKTSQKTKIAILSIGYGDGIKRSLSNRGKVLFYDSQNNLFEAPIIGNISMDLLACDVTNIPEELTDIYRKAALLDNNYTINEMSNDAKVVNYEILTSIHLKSKRFKTRYV